MKKRRNKDPFPKHYWTSARAYRISLRDPRNDKMSEVTMTDWERWLFAEGWKRAQDDMKRALGLSEPLTPEE